ncbi:hypothetical protein [Fretibacter rubidus]
MSSEPASKNTPYLSTSVKISFALLAGWVALMGAMGAIAVAAI